MIKVFLAIAIPAVLTVGVLSLWSYGGVYVPSVTTPRFDDISVAQAPAAVVVEAPADRRGVLVLDTLHRNGFQTGEVNVLLAKVTARGYSIDYLGPKDPREFFRASPEDRLELLRDKLRGANALVVILPREAYSAAEAKAVEEFVDKGGRLLLVGDPSRSNMINSLAEGFGLLVERGYLYNLKEHETNYQNIFVRSFRPHLLTRNLKELAFYAASSVRPTEAGLAVTDDYTYSSYTQGTGFAPMALSSNSQVLALGDFTFMVEPFSTTADNNQLISNIAEFLTSATRKFSLADFPHFFPGEVDVQISRQSLLERGTAFRQLLQEKKRPATLVNRENVLRDTVFIGLLSDAPQVGQYLREEGIEVGQRISTPFTPDLDRNRTGLLYLYRGKERNVLILLAENESEMAALFQIVRNGRFRTGLVNQNVGLYKLFPRGEEAPAERSGQE